MTNISKSITLLVFILSTSMTSSQDVIEYTNRYSIKDGTLAAGYLILAARALGYGTVFCTDSIPEELTKKVFNIPDHFTRICITPVGVPDEWPESPPKKSLEELVVHETF